MSKISNNLEAVNSDLLAACFSLSGITDMHSGKGGRRKEKSSKI